MRERELEVHDEHGGLAPAADLARRVADPRVSVGHAARPTFFFSMRSENVGCLGASCPVSVLQRPFSSSIVSNPRSKSFTAPRSARSFSRSFSVATLLALPSALI